MLETTLTLGGPVPGTRMTAEYIKHLASIIYLWGWPMVNVHNRVAQFRDVPAPCYLNGIVPVAPINHLCMLTDYIKPEQRAVACPNQDVVYGIGGLDLCKEPVVVQVPDFGDRFWVYQICDERTDSFASMGKLYGTKAGCYLLAHRDWNGKWPEGVTDIFICPTDLGVVMPRIFLLDDTADRLAIQPQLNGIMLYPLSGFNGQAKTTDWSKTPVISTSRSGEQHEMAWVKPEVFFDQLPIILKEVPPLPGEEVIYAQINGLLETVHAMPDLKSLAIQCAVTAETELIAPLFDFVNVGYPVKHNWTTQRNGAAFGTDYLTRAACAKSNIFVNQPQETRYFYLDLDADGVRLDGNHAYTITFAKGQLPPVKGFWSLTAYNREHFFSPNTINRYSVGTKNKDLRIAADGSLTVYVQNTATAADKQNNWLPVPAAPFSLYLRCYWPEEAVLNDDWTPPAVIKVN
jgi:hypothetical protein